MATAPGIRRAASLKRRATFTNRADAIAVAIESVFARRDASYKARRRFWPRINMDETRLPLRMATNYDSNLLLIGVQSVFDPWLNHVCLFDA
jgi:hypothetical protein